MVSCDGFQSASLRQDLYTAGINKNVKDSYISLDKTPTGYETFKLALQEKRIHMFESPTDSLFISEFTDVQKDSMTEKIDHTTDGCFTDDTKIRLVDGRSLTIKDLLLEQSYKDNYVYTFNEEKKIIEPKKIKKVFQTKITKDLVKVTLDNGETVTCTPNHKFMLRDGAFEEIQNIKPGTSLMPLYTKYPDQKQKFHDYRLYYEPIEERWHFEHRRFCNNIIHKKNYVVHHKNYNKKDNTPKNLEMHKRQSESLRNTIDKLYPKTKRKEKLERIREVEKVFNIDYSKLSTGEKNSYSNKIAMLKDPSINKRKASYKLETHQNLHNIHHTKCWITNGIENKYVNKTELIPDGWYKGRSNVRKKEYKNHKVVSIEKITKPCRVYDLEIEDNHNFALDIGVFVHNSKDLLDSLVGAVYSASKFLQVGDISTLDNYSAFVETNVDEVEGVLGTSVANQFFDEFNVVKEKTETEIQNEKIDREIKTIKELRNNLDEEDKNISDRELLELYNSNNFEGNDMLLF